MAKFVCTVCGYVYEGDAAPEQCPVCKAPAKMFKAVEGELQLAAEHEYGVYERGRGEHQSRKAEGDEHDVDTRKAEQQRGCTHDYGDAHAAEYAHDDGGRLLDDGYLVGPVELGQGKTRRQPARLREQRQADAEGGKGEDFADIKT